MIHKLIGGRKPKPKPQRPPTKNEVIIQMALSFKEMAEKAHEKLMLRADEQLSLLNIERERDLLALQLDRRDMTDSPPPTAEPEAPVGGRLRGWDNEDAYKVDLDNPGD